MKNKYYVSWSEVFSWINIIQEEYYDYIIFGIPKGGMLLSGMFRKNSVVFNESFLIKLYKENQKLLIIDDIIDSGYTKEKWLKNFINVKFEAMFDKQKNEDFKKLGWLVFPWENDEIDIDENIDRLIQYYSELNYVNYERNDFKKYIIKYFKD